MNFVKYFRRWDRSYLPLVLILGLIHGLIYVFIIPPWQHYDEPNHLEYAALTAKSLQIPEPGDFDQTMRRAIAESMIKHGFFKNLNFLPNLDSQTEPIWIGGYSQLTNPPFYYVLVAAAVRLLGVEDVTNQLYVGRLVSLFLYLLSILAAWGVAVEITPEKHPLRLLIPLTVALIPGYTDLMTAVNNDVGAIAFFGLVLWASIRLIKRGLAVAPLLLSVILLALIFYTKETAYFALPVFLIALVFSVLRGQHRWIAWSVFISVFAIVIVAIVVLDDAALWYRSTSQASPTRVATEKAVIGQYALQLETWAEITPVWLFPTFQPVPEATGFGKQGKTYTMGGWMWASEPIETITPIFNYGKQNYSEPVSLGTEPQFFAFSVTLTEEPIQRVWISIQRSVANEEEVVVYYDGLVLAEGQRPITEPPVFESPSGDKGYWGGEPFRNLIRNGSFEDRGFRFRPWADRIGTQISPDQTRPSLVLTYLFDWPGAHLFYRASMDRVFRTFWGLFGWAHVPLLGFHPYRILMVFTLLGIAGTGLALWRKRFNLDWEIVLLLVLTLLVIWGMTFVRGAAYVAMVSPYFPVARYAYPAIIPTALVLCLGWLEILNIPGRWLKIPRPGIASLYVLFFIALDILAIMSILKYYRS